MTQAVRHFNDVKETHCHYFFSPAGIGALED